MVEILELRRQILVMVLVVVEQVLVELLLDLDQRDLHQLDRLVEMGLLSQHILDQVCLLRCQLHFNQY